MSWLKLFVTFRAKVWLIQMIFFNMIGKICLILSDVLTHTALPLHPLYTMHPQGHALDQSLEIWGVQKRLDQLEKAVMYLGWTNWFIPVIGWHMYSQTISVFLRFSTMGACSGSVLKMSRLYMIYHMTLGFILLITPSTVPNSPSVISGLGHQRTYHIIQISVRLWTQEILN